MRPTRTPPRLEPEGLVGAEVRVPRGQRRGLLRQPLDASTHDVHGLRQVYLRLMLLSGKVQRSVVSIHGPVGSLLSGNVPGTLGP